MTQTPIAKNQVWQSRRPRDGIIRHLRITAVYPDAHETRSAVTAYQAEADGSLTEITDGRTRRTTTMGFAALRRNFVLITR